MKAVKRIPIGLTNCDMADGVKSPPELQNYAAEVTE